MERENQLIIVRGGGDIATGTIHKLHRCGYPVLVLETAAPSAIRRQVALSEAVYDGVSEVEGAECVRVSGWKEARKSCPGVRFPFWWTRNAKYWRK